MRKIMLLLIVLAVAVLLASCVTTAEEGEVRSVSNKPIMDVLVGDTVYKAFDLDRSLNVIEVKSIDDWEDLTENILIVNASSVDFKELSLSFIGSSKRSGTAEKPVLLNVFKDIPANSKKKFSPDLKIRDYTYIIFNVENPEGANVKVTYLQEGHDDLYVYFSDI